MDRLKAHGQRGIQMGQRGVAIIAAIVALAVAGTMAAEFSTNTTIDYVAASNARENMRGELLARSGVNLARLIIRVQTDFLDKPNIRRFIGDMQLADFAPLFMGAFGGSKDEVANTSAMLGGIAGEEIKGLGVPYGQFEVEITTEDNKINVNCANDKPATKTNLQTKLEALFFFDVYNPIFETADATEWRRDRKEQVAAIIDYVDSDTDKHGQPGATEAYGYGNLKDPYLPKNNSLDSIQELKLVRGVDDRFWTVFGSNFTVYGGCKENLGAIQDPRMVMPLIFLTAKNPNDPVLKDPIKLWLLSKRVAEARALGIYFDKTQAWADFVKDPDGALQAAAEGGDGTTQLPSSADGFVPVQGVEIDLAKLNQIALVGPRRTYRVESTATIGRLKRRIMAVWDTVPTNQNSRDAAAYRTGSWVFWREE